jgi:hypothetical protein
MIVPSATRYWWFWKKARKLPSYEEVLESVPTMRSTSSYLIFSDGEETCVIEKDRVTGKCCTSNTFISVTNNDLSDDSTSQGATKATLAVPDLTGMKEILEESVDRKRRLEEQYKRLVKQNRENNRYAQDEKDVCLEQYQVENLVNSYPTTNECTHFAVIMDPHKNNITWGKLWRDSPNAKLLPRG